MRKVICLVLVILLGLSVFTSCDKKNESSSSESAISDAESQQVESMDPLGKYDAGITLTSVAQTINTYTFPEGDDMSNNPYTRYITEKLGITVAYDWLVDVAQYTNKLNISIASNDIPDFFYCDSKTFGQLANAGKLADITEVYDAYASTDLKEYGNSFLTGFNSAVIDSKLQALPQLGFGQITTSPGLWIRSDWMTKLGLSAPKSMAELMNMASKFKSEIEGCTAGIALENTFNYPIENIIGFCNAYHAYPFSWVKDSSGKIVYGSTQPEMKTALTALQDMYKDGLIDKEFAIKDVNKVNEDIINGKVGIAFSTNWASYWPFTDALKKDANAVWKPYPIPSADDKAVKVQSSWSVTNYVVINKNCKNPEAIIKMANLHIDIDKSAMFSDAVKYNNMPWQAYPVVATDPMNDIKQFLEVSKAIDAKSTTNLSAKNKAAYDLAMTWVDKKDPLGYGTYFQLASEGSLGIVASLFDANNVLLTEIKGANPASLDDKAATLLKLEQEAYTKIIMGEDTIDKFDQFVLDWNKLGGELSTKDVNDMYK